jgi:cellulose synthase/poly-beta-1,6-N-acetylglucosamine synthase-like glycosyltransferase
LAHDLLIKPVAGPVRHEANGHAFRPARFLPERGVRWTIVTILALVVAIAVGLAIPWLMEPLAQWLPASAQAAEQPWVRPVLTLWYILFVLLVVCPFAVFWAWSRLCPPRSATPGRNRWPKVTILIPAFNEQEMILDAIHGALSQDYADFEVIVIDDGSTDLTPYLAATQPVRLIRMPRNAGKAAALNRGLEAARGAVIVTCDADGYLDPKAVRHLVRAFSDPQVAGVAGQVRLFQPTGLLRRFQVLEYDSAQGLHKLAQYATTGTVLVAPGPVSAFRADVLRSLGGIPGETLTEDFDLTLMLISRGYKVSYEPRALASTDAPQTDAALQSQRIRWSRGGFQVLCKYGQLVGERRSGLVGLFWLPYLMFAGYLSIPVAALMLGSLPLLAWGSGAPLRFLGELALYAVVVLGFELATMASGVMACNRRDWRHLFLAPLFCLYKNWRLRWFTAQALYREWRGAAKVWSG